MKKQLYLSAAVVGCAGGVGAGAGAASPPVNVAIDADDIGGVVTGANGPEAGVWVIAETTDLPHQDSPRSSSPTTRAATSSPICRRPTTTSGCAATASSIRPRSTASPGKRLNLTAVPAPNDDGGGRILSGDLLVLDAQDAGQERVPRHRDQRQRHSRTMKTQSQWLDSVKTNGCVRCHQLGNKATRTIPEALGAVQDPAMRRGRAASSPARPAANMISNIDRLDTQRALRHVRRLDRPHRQGRAAGREAAAPAGRRAQRRRHAVGLVRCRRPICTTRSRPTSATRPSTPTARSTARPRTRPTTCRCSIR